MSNSSVRARGFEKAEASLRLEGMDPSGTPLYEGIKQRIIAIDAKSLHSTMF